MRAALLPDTLAADERATARRAYAGTLARTGRLLARVRAILDAAASQGLTILPYKGALFAEALYGDPGLRALGDLDLLVVPDELARGERLLEELGFRRVYPRGTPRFEPRHAHDVAFEDEADPDCRVELHYRLFHELGGDPSLPALFARAIRVELLGAARLAPSWDDHLFAVLTHAGTDAFGVQAGWLVDVQLLVAHGASLDRALAEGRRRGLGTPVLLAWHVAHQALGAALPSPPPLGPADRLRARLLARLLGPTPWSGPPSQPRSIAARAVLTESPVTAARDLVRKSLLRLREAAASASRTGHRRSGT